MLVLLRVAIGWHFFKEGVSHKNDPTWSSEGFLRMAKGPLAAEYQRQVNDFHGWDRLLLAPLPDEPAHADKKGTDKAPAKPKPADDAKPPEDKTASQKTPAKTVALKVALTDDDSQPKGASGEKAADDKKADDQKTPDHKAADERSADAKSGDTKPSDAEPADKKPDEKTSDEKKTDDKKPEPAVPETPPGLGRVDARDPKAKPSDKKPVEKIDGDKPEEKPAEPKNVEKPAAESPATDKPAAEKTSGKPATDKPATEKPAAEKPADKKLASIDDTHGKKPDVDKAGDKKAKADNSADLHEIWYPWLASAGQDWQVDAEQVADYYQFDPAQRQRAAELLHDTNESMKDMLRNVAPDLQLYRQLAGRAQQMRNEQDINQTPFMKARAAGIRQNPLNERGIGGAALESTPPEWMGQAKTIDSALHANLVALATEDQMKKFGPLPDASPLHRLDQTVIWVLIITGGLLIVGLFARLAALVAAAFLLSVILSQPPWIAGTVSTYDQVVECIAALVLVAIPVGRWAGLDYFVHNLFSRSCCPAENHNV